MRPAGCAGRTRFVGHFGGIYRDSTAIDLGRTKPSHIWLTPTGTVVAEAGAAVPGGAGGAELLVQRIDLQLAQGRGSTGALLQDERRPSLYAELVERAPAQG